MPTVSNHKGVKLESHGVSQVGVALHHGAALFGNTVTEGRRLQAARLLQQICFLSQVLEELTVLINVASTGSLRANIRFPNPSHMFLPSC